MESKTGSFSLTFEGMSSSRRLKGYQCCSLMRSWAQYWKNGLRFHKDLVGEIVTVESLSSWMSVTKHFGQESRLSSSDYIQCILPSGLRTSKRAITSPIVPCILVPSPY
ncbi:hypothetical protein CEXT_725721 [Caerostris extrusa]|uniref:Uncharacterized protein n=1 Tax=Caerostris extrusa TaxID=172846 RepID=A0AAV4MIN6_CAEEX|nr:hypothetical protein CEXT_725721 [Caerostris extrusa]